ncbi:acetolactate synthase large subunit [Aquamicrobium sp. LC103]|uniref:acetolactate synthase large subunit n=1 Tax=Aquamicrobium sp. LC103 TaxID=1120658 RepID=UPI00063EBCB9|nr:acetolactate synthase large subunit [Aquamicrobium sp. LC103]TKT78251.1 acetolactate synthase large subunit [Aquamicrobium sp. LC103]
MTANPDRAGEAAPWTGADQLCETLLDHGVDTCFANPGTSEMHFVAALDRQPRMRCILGLFEGVVTGAADGYGRMLDRPAATLLHLGPGLANGLANLHNAKRAGTSIINVVGDHSTTHLPLDAPLTSDIDSLAAPMSNWMRRMTASDRVAADVADAWRASMTKGVATLVLPADVAWSATDPAPAMSILQAPAVSKADAGVAALVADAVAAGRQVGIVLSGKALRESHLAIAGRLMRRGIKVFAQGANGRIERGHGRFGIERLSFNGDIGRRQLAGIELLALVDAREPVTFFGYPGQSGRQVPDGCQVMTLATRDADLLAALEEFAERAGAPEVAPPFDRHVPDLPVDGALTVDAVNRILANLLPEQAIVCDEAITSVGFYDHSTYGAPHDYLQLTGGAIGIGIPMATGAAVACPDRKVVTLQADGSGMYTMQGLWTQAREALDVVTVVFANNSYAILHGEMRRMGIATPGENARRMLDLDKPEIGWTQLANSLGVEAERVTTSARFGDVLASALNRRGPFLIEAAVA